jgi:hypothetical protein
MSSLPKSFKLDDPVPALPEGASSILMSCRPVSGGAFLPSAVIDVDLGTRGFLDPASLSIRYTVATVVPATNAAAMAGTPVYTPIQRLQISANGSTIDTISQYNQVAHVLTQGYLDVAAKFGRQAAYGYTPIASTLTTAPSLFNMDCRVSGAGATDTYTVSAPLPCVLSQCEKMLPLFAMGGLRLTFTLDTLANMFATGLMYSAGAAVTYQLPTSCTITNFEVCYSMIDLGQEAEQMVRGMGARLFLKSHSFNNSATSSAAGATGSLSFVFNQRYSSIRSAYVLPNQVIGNKWAEIVDLTCGLGDYQLQIGNSAYPQMPLSTVNNKAGILQETYRAFQAINSFGSMSIDTAEFNVLASTVLAALNPYEPGKFFVGVNLEKVATADHVLMSGVSTYNTPINVVINSSAVSANVLACNINLLLDYDCIITIDQEGRQVSVRS